MDIMINKIVFFILIFNALGTLLQAQQSHPQYLGFPPRSPEKQFELSFAETLKRKSFIVRVVHDPNYHGAFPEDQFVLLIYSPSTKTTPILSHRFNSSYMEFDLKAEDLTGDGIEELILLQGIGRGSNVRSEKLTVFQWNESNLHQILSVPFSGFCGVNPWAYSLTFPKEKQDEKSHLAIKLSEIPVVGGLCSSDQLPKYAYKEYCWSETKKLMSPYRFIRREENRSNK
jgi:hypothetical protein